MSNTSSSAAHLNPLVAVDTLIFTVLQGRLCVLLMQIGGGPYAGKWALPGGLVRMDESLDEAAERVLDEKAGVNGIYLEQLYSFGDKDRDIRGRSVSVAYFALVNSDFFMPEKTEYAVEIKWHPVSRLPRLAFDHAKIIALGKDRLQNKLAYSTIAYGLLAKTFTLSQLQAVYEAILERSLDKRNFRKKILSLGIVKGTGKWRKGEASRPAQLFAFAERKPRFVDIL